MMCKRWADRTTFNSDRVIMTDVMITTEADVLVHTLAATDRTPGYGYRVCVNIENYHQAVICRELMGTPPFVDTDDF